ncbi:MAG: hypothetical protein NZM38_05055 [Cytophagales bacterium]|nr:hypothetical protein [Cytophagales bacterium]MDW8384121.1 hypothetical protein [Flammeovirgaceae bacterium]
MKTCGYVCPQCEGKGYDEEGNACSWCIHADNDSHSLSDEEWLKHVHQTCVCSDITGIEKE